MKLKQMSHYWSIYTSVYIHHFVMPGLNLNDIHLQQVKLHILSHQGHGYVKKTCCPVASNLFLVLEDISPFIQKASSLLTDGLE